MQKDETKHKDFSHCFEQSAVLALFSVWRIADKGFSFYIPLLTGIGKTSDNDGELETPEVATVSDNNGWWPMAIHGRRRQSWRNGAMAHAEAHWDFPPCASLPSILVCLSSANPRRWTFGSAMNPSRISVFSLHFFFCQGARCHA